ncbi:MAG: AmmeMemoRadiSam system radical SAM enzyme [Candidatus Korarchaeota archaeon]
MESFVKEAMFYKKLDGRVQCMLCPRHCILSDGQRGACRVRENIKGKLHTLVYGRVVAYNIDPIEKKPFYHFYPGNYALSIATAGCNLRCLHCQNWDISQMDPEQVPARYFPPEKVVADAIEHGTLISYTYIEPTVFYEYMYDTAKIARARNVKNTIVSNGYIEKEPATLLADVLDAVKIDIKAFSDDFYRRVTYVPSMEPVLESTKLFFSKGLWVELVYLVIPGYNDSMDEIREFARWIRKNLSDIVPVHFTGYYPAYKMDAPPTPLTTVKKARMVAMEEGLKYVYSGNFLNDPGQNTYCPVCNKVVIERRGYKIDILLDDQNRCPSCGNIIPIIR